jgi:drug/metabolite transporter (DMT)-like permease
MFSHILIFILALSTKAWEPLSVVLSQKNAQATPFPIILMICDLLKLIFTFPIIIYKNTFTTKMICSYESIYSFLPVSILLNICNLSLGYAIPRLDPMLYQIIFKAVSIYATVILSKLLLKYNIGCLRYISLIFLIIGAYICTESPSQTVNIPNQWYMGIFGLFCGAFSLSLSTVLFECASENQNDRIFENTGIIAIWSFCFNTCLCIINWKYIAPNYYDMIAAFSIGITDIIMTIFLTIHGSNAYSYARVMALLLSTFIACMFFKHKLTILFIIGACVILMSGWVYYKADIITNYFSEYKSLPGSESKPSVYI